MVAVETAMAEESSQHLHGEEFCVYASAKVDDQVMPRVKAAAALAEVSTQEYMSKILNEVASKALGLKPIKRRPPKPKDK